jgi:hypothetical protein
MSRESYLAATTEWVSNGRKGLRPSAPLHEVMLTDFTPDELHQAEDKGDPRPPAISSWWWFDNDDDPLRWHAALRATHAGGPVHLVSEKEAALSLYNSVDFQR